MIRPEASEGPVEPALERLAGLEPLDDLCKAMLRQAIASARPVPPREEVLREGMPVAEPRLMVSGWAAHIRVLPDGRRQLLSLLLPGDLIGMYSHPRLRALSSVVALTEVSTCPLPSDDLSPHLQKAYASSRALENTYLFAQITRLGRLSAHERLGDLLLELNERLTPCGIANNGRFPLPLTQETLADVLGLTPVHLNRTLQLARRRGELDWKAGYVMLNDPVALAETVGRTAVRLTAA